MPKVVADMQDGSDDFLLRLPPEYQQRNYKQ